MDLVRIRWSWRPALNRYAPEPPEKVPGEQVGQEQLRQLYADLRPAAFEAVPRWSLDSKRPHLPGGRRSVVQFDAASRRIAIKDGDTLESFAWRDTVRTLFDRIVVVAENEAVSRIRRTFSIRATGAVDHLASPSAATTSGTPASSTSRASPTGPRQRPDAASAVTPARRVRGGPTGSRSASSTDSLVWTANAASRRGTWVSFPLGGPDDPDGAVPRRTTGNPFVARRREGTRDKTAVTRKLTLAPVNLTAEGWEETAGESLELTQSEKLAKP